MSGLILAAFLSAQAPPSAAAGTEVRALTVSFVDDKDGAVSDLAPADVALVENGVARDVISFKPDRRPLSVAVVLDSSAALESSFRLSLVDPVASFVARLPEGSHYALWTTGDRPRKLQDFTDELMAAGDVLKRVATQGGNRMLDALPEVASDLRKLAREGSRTVVLAITATGLELSDLDRFRSVEASEKTGALFLSVQIDEGEADFETRTRVGYVLDRLAAVSGGRHETILSPMGIESALRKLSAVLRGGYRLAYATSAGLKKRKLELRVARPRTKVLLPVASSSEP